MLGFPFSEDAFLVGLASSERVVKDASELMGRGGDCFWCAEFGAHAAVLVPECRLVVMPNGVTSGLRTEPGAMLLNGFD